MTSPSVTDPAPTPAVRGGAERAWHNPDFRLYWLAHGLLLLANQANLLATQWLVLDLTASRTLLGVVALIQGVVVASLSPLGGVLADRLPRRTVLAAGRWVAAGVEITLAAGAFLGIIEYVHALIGVALMAAVLALLQPAAQTYVFDLLSRRQVMSGVALITSATSLFQVAGPALGGLLVVALGVSGSYLLAAAALVCGGVLLSLLSVPGHTTPPKARTSLLTDLREGLRQAQRTPLVRWLLILTLGNVLASSVFILRPVIARDVLGVGAAGFSAMSAAYAAGSITATVLLVWLGQVQRKGLLLLGVMAAWDIGAIVYSLSRSLEVTLVCEYVLGLVAPSWSMSMMTMLQTTAPPEQRGRVMGLFFFVMQSMFIGQFVSGVLADHIGPSATIVVGGVARLLFVLILLIVAAPVRDYGRVVVDRTG